MQMQMRIAAQITAMIAIFLVIFALPANSAHAGFFDRVQDIYNAPKKIDQIEQQYIEKSEQLQKQLETSQQAAEQLALKQEELLAQNNQLIEQNASLQAELEQMRKDKSSLLDKLTLSVSVVTALILLYVIAVRVWRYASWRRHRRLGERGISG
ncbi:hypothetical protein [Paenibacillus sp. NEAU-GSW1]|uniref:hypothetical protein n=1 Tax=Paenibacillus sp. NEAU-GSW1 TaxID=2682486 RepID=UPI0012E246B9|nr:hypothetical protein [Paenibacillus sp. NEAU-GSW1]MUT64654.1 hypothetical protein [Paenibacillus sp. NEAU-GSW1]